MVCNTFALMSHLNSVESRWGTYSCVAISQDPNNAYTIQKRFKYKR